MKKHMLFFLLLILGSALYAQNKEVSGVVVDEMGIPMFGVSIVVKGTNIEVITDMDGRFIINAPVGSILVFSYVGYITMEVKVQKNTGAIKVIMSPGGQEHPIDYIPGSLFSLSE